MTTHVIGTSHILPLRKAMGGDPEGLSWYYANNSDYQDGDFLWTRDGLTHSSDRVKSVWAKLTGQTSIQINPDDVILAFGFDDRYDRYSFLAGGADHVSVACRELAVRDLVASSVALRMISLIRENHPPAKAIMVEPPLLSRKEQVKKFFDRMVLKSRLEELYGHHKAVAAGLGAVHIAQTNQTILAEGDYVYTPDEFLAADGFHWGSKGIEIVKQQITSLLG